MLKQHANRGAALLFIGEDGARKAGLGALFGNMPDGEEATPHGIAARKMRAGLLKRARSAPPAKQGLYGAGSRAFFLHTSRNALGVHSYSSLKSLLKYEEFLYPTE